MDSSTGLYSRVFESGRSKKGEFGAELVEI
jgi:hypothetical protein